MMSQVSYLYNASKNRIIESKVICCALNFNWKPFCMQITRWKYSFWVWKLEFIAQQFTRTHLISRHFHLLFFLLFEWMNLCCSSSFSCCSCTNDNAWFSLLLIQNKIVNILGTFKQKRKIRENKAKGRNYFKITYPKLTM